VNHTSRHSIAIKKLCDEVGVPAVLKIGAAAQDGNPVEFLLKRLKP
jgi:hypothetical protein